MSEPISDAIKLAREARLKHNLEKQRNELKRLVLENIAFLARLREKYPHNPDTSADWVNEEDLVTYCLKNATEDELASLRAELTGVAPPRRKETAKQSLGGFSFVQPFIDIITGLFSGEKGGFLGLIMEMFHKIQVAMDPSVPLNADEQAEFEDSDLFVTAGKISDKIGKEVNALYRKLQQEAYTKEQKLNGLLKYIKKKVDKKEAKAAHKLLKITEIKLLDGKKIGSLNAADFDALANTVENEIIANLKRAVGEANKLKPSIPAVAMLDLDVNDQRIASAARAVKNLLSQIYQQERAIKNSSLKEEKLAIYQTMQESKRKILQFLLKTRALAYGETLSVGKLFGFEYMTEQLNKFPEIRLRNEEFSDRRAVSYATKGNEGIFKLFTNTDQYVVSSQAINNAGAYQEAIEKANDSRFAEITSQIEKAQAVVGKLHGLWVEHGQVIRERVGGAADLNRRAEQKIQLEIQAVEIQAKIKTLVADLKLLKTTVPAPAVTTEVRGVDATAEVLGIINSKSPIILSVEPGIAMARLGGGLEADVLRDVNPSMGGQSCANHAEKFNLIKRLQNNAADLLKQAEDAKQAYFPAGVPGRHAAATAPAAFA